MKGYNGVAILSRVPVRNRPRREAGAPAPIAATRLVVLPGGIELHNIYVPAGGDIADPDANPKFAHKLQFLDEVDRMVCRRAGWIGRPMVAVGDFNIAPLETDVWSHKQLLERRQPYPGRGRPPRPLAAGRRFCRRGTAFCSAAGAALYLVELSRPRLGGLGPRPPPRPHLGDAPRLSAPCPRPRIYRDSRSWDKASDHVPVMLTIGELMRR